MPLNPPSTRPARSCRLSPIRVVLCVACLVGAVTCAACSGSGEGLDDNGRPVGEGGEATDKSEFTRIQQTVFTPLCIQCHQGAAAPLGLRLDADNSYALLVGVASVEVPSLLRVAPGLPDDSYLVRKVQGTAAVGGRMPLDGPRLLQSSIDLIRSWIAGGAQPPPTRQSASFRVLATVPAVGDTVDPPLDEVTLVFSAPVDAALAVAGTFELEMIGDGTTASGGVLSWREVAIRRVTVSPASPAVVTVAPERPLSTGFYRLRVRGQGATVLADVDARVLDGDGGGRPGTDYQLAFEVAEEVAE